MDLLLAKETYKGLENLENAIGYTFNNKNLLLEALNHRSYANETNKKSNERLEFLGDSILEFVMTENLYKILPNTKEGEMTKIRAYIVCEESLYDVAKKLKFENYIRLGKSQLKSGGKSKPILADMVEAIIAAIYLDSNMENSKKFILNNLKDRVNRAIFSDHLKDYKTILQETIQEKGTKKIEYTIIDESGPDHEKIFTVKLEIGSKEYAIASGKSKKEAQTKAAKLALIKMNIIKDN